jgi:hypothetical protein
MTDLHFNLLHETKDGKYIQIVYGAATNLVEFRRRNNIADDISDIELCLMALYGVLMLKLQKKEVSKETTLAMDSFSKVLAYLSKKFKDIEEKDLLEE